MDYAVLALICMTVAAFGSLIGAGGGFLLMPIFLLFYAGRTMGGMVLGKDELAFISLCAVMINGFAASYNYGRMRRVDYRTALLLAVCATPPALIARIAMERMDGGWFSMIFGVLLFGISAFIFWRVLVKHQDRLGQPEVKSHWTQRRLVDAHGEEHAYAFDMRIGMGVAGFEGALAGFFGIGGGFLRVPVMTQLLHFPAHVASATSMLILTISTTAVVIFVIAKGLIEGGQNLPMGLAIAGGAGAFVGAQIGTRLSKRVSAGKLLILVAIALIIGGITLIAKPFLDGRSAPAPSEPPAERM